ncbi:hypothetical protein ZWY2020_045894 [Hordeum vulgare]|nr:hypothetical protein ZWY2020_045894 [Hordeum vulgare]
MRRNKESDSFIIGWRDNRFITRDDDSGSRRSQWSSSRRPSYGVEIKSLDSSNEYADRLPIVVRIAERGWFDGASVALLNDSTGYSPTRRPAMPVVLDFAIDSMPVVATSGCPVDRRRSACRSSHASCRNVSGIYRSGYVCRCLDGYQGNPYLSGGCQDIDEYKLPGMCFGECTKTGGGHLCWCPHGAQGDRA